jgi:M6 family metalloprotease-like protein
MRHIARLIDPVPQAARHAWCIVVALLALLVVDSRPAAAQGPQTLEGVLGVLWGDPQPGSIAGGATFYTLTRPDGSVLRLDLPGLESRAIQYSGQRVTVSARVSDAQPVPGGDAQATAIVESIELAPANAVAGVRADVQSAAVTGTKKVIYLLVKFADDTAVPHAPSFFTDMTNPDTPPAGQPFPSTINGFFKKTSSNLFSWIADVGGVGGVGASGGWLTLPHNKSYYAPCGFAIACFNVVSLSEDSMSLGRAQGINFTNYDNINFVLSNDLDCCAWGGSYYSSIDNKSYGATWEPPWGQNVGTYAHELGHSIGLPHSGWAYYAYDSPWDVMSISSQSATAVNCGTYSSINSGGNRTLTCSEPGDGYISAHKDFLGWIPAGNITTVYGLNGTTVTLDSSATPNGANPKLIKICVPGYPCSGSLARYFSVEARTKGQGATTQYDNGIPGEGIIIHDVQFDRAAIGGICYFNNQSGWAVPLDATPGDYDSNACNSGGRVLPNYALYNAQFTAGMTYENTRYAFRVQVHSRSGTTFVVSVTSTLSNSFLKTRSDFDGDGRSEIGYYRPSTGTWALRQSHSAFGTSDTLNFQWGLSNDLPVPGYFDGDGALDIAVYRPSTGEWFIRFSSNGYATNQGGWFQWGLQGDVPLAADFDGDRRTDLGVYRPSTGEWYLRLSWNNYNASQGGWFQWGLQGDLPMIADFDGDGKVDISVYRPSTGEWFIRYSSLGYAVGAGNWYFQWGLSGDTPIASDFDGDGKADIAVYRPTSGDWYIRNSASNYVVGAGNWYFQWGLSGDRPLLSDFDGDGKTDISVYRPTSGEWYIRYSSLSYFVGAGSWYFVWGASADTPLPTR